MSEALTELAQWQRFEGWVRSSLGMTVNLYPLRAGGQSYEAGQVFLRKDKATGRTAVLDKQSAWERYAAHLDDAAGIDAAK